MKAGFTIKGFQNSFYVPLMYTADVILFHFQLLSEELLKYANNLLALNGSCLTFLEKAYTKLTHVLDVNGKIPVKK